MKSNWIQKLKPLMRILFLWNIVFAILVWAPFSLRAQGPMGNLSLSTHSAVQDERITDIAKKLEDQSTQITKMQTDLNELQRDVYMWKGAVVGFGAFVSFLEVLQALGALGKEKTRRAQSLS